MIKYRLVCAHDHTFDAWFRDSAAYDALAEAGSVQCPTCGTVEVSKALMAPNLARRKGADDRPARPPEAETPAESPAAEATAAVPAVTAAPDKRTVVAAAMGQALRQLRAVVEQNCDNVGDRFAEEARKIHYGEAKPRGIYGETTPEETRELEEEGVEFHTLPWVKPDA